MWNRVRDLAARLYPIGLLLAIVWIHDALADRAAGLHFANRNNERRLAQYQDGGREVTLSAYENLTYMTQGAVDNAGKSAMLLFWLLIAGSLGYLLFARESLRFRLCVFGGIAVTMILLTIFGSIY